MLMVSGCDDSTLHGYRTVQHNNPFMEGGGLLWLFLCWKSGIRVLWSYTDCSAPRGLFSDFLQRGW